ncbi:MAG: methyl-accepting chemotaxis protein [Huintestinicola sp.]
MIGISEIKNKLSGLKGKLTDLASGSSKKKSSFADGEIVLTRKTSIRSRILRLTILSSTILATVITIVILCIMYADTSKRTRSEAETYAISYASAISNADISNNGFLKVLFEDFDQHNTYGGYGFAVTASGGVISNTAMDILNFGDNIITLSETNDGFYELAQLINTFSESGSFNDQETASQPIGNMDIKLCGKNYIVSWSRVEKYEGVYTIILLPNESIIASFIKTVIICILLLLILFSIIIAISVRVSNNITDPITKACSRLQLLAGGDLESPSPATNRNDETYVLLSSLSNTIERMKNYINDIKMVLNAVSAGDLRVKSQAEYSGDFAAIRDSLEKILFSLNNTFSDVNRAALQVKECSGQVANGATTLSQSASVEAVTIEKLTASVADVAEKIRLNAENAEKASDKTRSADEFVVKSSESMSQMVAAISEIEVSSAQISKIIKVIDDIAFQTNILALNAAVEAARAGTAGKGFAVVADEVRNLATRSAEAAAQTEKLINNATKSVRKGTELASVTSEALNEIVQVVSEVSLLVDDIAVSADKQASTVAEISSGMEMINGSVHTTSSTAEQSAAASEELSGQSDLLNGMINRFKFNKI